MRRHLQQKGTHGLENMATQIKKAADSLLTHTFRVYDQASALKVKGCGPLIARASNGTRTGCSCSASPHLDVTCLLLPACTTPPRLAGGLHVGSRARCFAAVALRTPLARVSQQIITSDLFGEYPPEPPSEEELEAERQQEAAIKAAAVSCTRATLHLLTARCAHAAGACISPV